MYAHWTYWLQILSWLCLQRVYFFENFEIVAISTEKHFFKPYCMTQKVQNIQIAVTKKNQ